MMGHLRKEKGSKYVKVLCTECGRREEGGKSQNTGVSAG